MNLSPDTPASEVHNKLQERTDIFSTREVACLFELQLNWPAATVVKADPDNIKVLMCLYLNKMILHENHDIIRVGCYQLGLS